MELELPTSQSLQRRFDALTAAHAEIVQISANLQDQLRELLSSCEMQPEDATCPHEYAAYADVAGKLRSILDGEQ